MVWYGNRVHVDSLETIERLDTVWRLFPLLDSFLLASPSFVLDIAGLQDPSSILHDIAMEAEVIRNINDSKGGPVAIHLTKGIGLVVGRGTADTKTVNLALVELCIL